MPSDQPLVHVIDDDDAIRQSLAFLLSTAKIEVKTYPSAAAFLEALPGVDAGLHHHRRAHARHQRHRIGAPAQGTQCRRPGDRHHRPWRRAARGRSDEDRRRRFSRKAVRRRGAAGERALGAQGSRTRRPSAAPNAARSKAASPRCRAASATCSAAWSPAAPTSRSPSTSAFHRARSKFIAPI